MERTHNVRRFRANPIEVAILSVAILIFVQSAYSLFYDYPDFHLAALTPMKSNPLTEGRVPSSTETAPLQTVALECGKTVEKDTTNSRVRLTGQICGITENSGKELFAQATVKNSANHQDATVFAEPTGGTFSTDYIPLNTGKNPIHIEFSFSNGKSSSQDLILNKL